ncbi:MAG: hypothetical protein K0Q72_1144 [Armatimonadetes bacterium]|nr:hypothetical protein [Armatimonadota bacterium]
MGTAVLILLLLALCGYIAYLGDLLGRRLGKKRLSVFGLRPKHTAILLTVITGVLIAAVTFGIAMAAVPGFRRVVTQGEKLNAQNAALRGENSRLDTEIAEGTRQNEALQKRNTVLAQANGRFIEENRKLQATNTKLEGDNKGLTASNRQLTTSNQSLQGQNTELRASNGDLKAKNGELVKSSAVLQSTNTRLEKEGLTLRRDLQALQTTVRTLRSDVVTLQQLANNYRKEEYVFRQGQLIGKALPIPADPPADVLRRIIQIAIAGSRDQVNERGLKRVRWVAPNGYPDNRSSTLNAFQEWIAQRAARERGKDLVLRVVAHENCVAGGTVPLRLDWYVNDRVFQKDEVIASRLVDGAAEEGDLLAELVFFLQTKVGPAASAREMAAGGDSVGELSYKQLLDACHKIKAVGGFVTVAALAKQDTLRSGPLNIYLDVRTQNTSSSSSIR